MIHREKRKIDVIIFLPEPVNLVDKLLARNKRLAREGERFKLYLSKRYGDIWEKLCEEGKRVDLIVEFR